MKRQPKPTQNEHTKIADFNLSVTRKQDVGTFDVTMDNSIRMQKMETLASKILN
jgi:hypothetical protein